MDVSSAPAMNFSNTAPTEQFREEFRQRLAKVGLSLHPDNMRLIAFGEFTLLFDQSQVAFGGLGMRRARCGEGGFEQSPTPYQPVCPPPTSLRMPAVRPQESPDALAAAVLRAEHGGCLRRAGADIRQSLDRYQSRISEIERVGVKEVACRDARLWSL